MSVKLGQDQFLIALIAILVQINIFSKRIPVNLSWLLILAFPYVGLAPLCFYELYRGNNQDFFAENYLLQYDSLQSRHESGNFKDSLLVRELLNDLPDSILNSSAESLTDSRLIFFKNYILIRTYDQSQNTETPPTAEPILSMYTLNGANILKLPIAGNTIRECLNDRYDEYKANMDAIQRPKQHLKFFDFWVESVTSFRFFYHIKPVSPLAKLLSILQLLLALVLVWIMGRTGIGFRKGKVG